MKTTRRIFASVLCVLMLITCMSVPSFAAEYSCAYSEDGVSYHQAYSLADAFEAIPNGGYVKLIKDVMITDTVNIFNRSVTVIGNDHRIIRDSAFTGAFFEINYTVSTAPVTEFKNVIFDGNRNNVKAVSSLVKVLNGVVNFDSVKMQNNYSNETWQGSNDYPNYGGALAIGNKSGTVNATVNMNDSVISNCFSVNGGAVIIWNNAEFNVENTTFTKNTVSNDGGAIDMVSSNARLNADGCVFTDNEATGWGGAINVEIGHAYLKDVTVTDNIIYYTDSQSSVNQDEFGGGISLEDETGEGNESSLTIDGKCIITGNYFVTGSVKTENNLFICASSVASSGFDDAKLTVASTFSNNSLVGISTNYEKTDADKYIVGAVEGVSNSIVSDTYGYTYYYDGTKLTYVKGEAVILNGTGYSVDKSTIFVTDNYGDLPELTRPKYSFIGWYTKTIDGELVEDYAPYISGTSPTTLFARWAPAEILYSVKGVFYGADTLVDAIRLCEDGGVVQLSRDVEIDGTVTIDKNITVKSSSASVKYKITRKDSATDGTMFDIASDDIKVVFENIEIDASPILGEGVKEPVANAGSNVVFNIGENAELVLDATVIENNFGGMLPGSALYINAGAKATVQNGSKIVNCSAENTGAAVYAVDNALVTFVDSSIENCYIRNNGNGGAIYAKLSDVELQNSSVKGCYASEKGGAVYLEGSTLSVNDNAVITENYLTGKDGYGAGVYLENSKLFVKGDAYIYDNLADKNDNEDCKPFENNVYFADGNSDITISGKLGYDSLIGITPNENVENRTVVDFIKYDGVTTADTEGRLKNDIGGYYMPNGEDSSMYCIVYKVTFDANKSSCEEQYRMVYGDVAIGELPVPEDRDDFTFEGWSTEPTYGEGTKYDAESMVSEDITLYAQWHNNYALDDAGSVIGRFFKRLGEIMRAAFSFLINLFGNTGTSDFNAVK